MNPIKIAVISGSVREGRLSHHLADKLVQVLNQAGTEAELIDLRAYPLPLLEYTFPKQPQPDSAMLQLQQRLEACDALVLLSPEYHGSYTGALKNALDYFQKEFYRKPIGVATTSTGKFGGINASTQLQHLILSLGAFPMPHKLIVPGIHQYFDAGGQMLDPAIEGILQKFAMEFTWFARTLVQGKLQPA